MLCKDPSGVLKLVGIIKEGGIDVQGQLLSPEQFQKLAGEDVM